MLLWWEKFIVRVHRIVPTANNNNNNDLNIGRRHQETARLTQAIQQAGGIKPLADIRQVQVLPLYS
jgi:polysaccharide export outer membrane protein